MLLVAALLAGRAEAQTQGTKLGPRPLLPPPTAGAPRLSVQELTKQADIIAIGKITEFRSEYNPARTRVFPRAILTPDEYMKGSETARTLSITYQSADAGPEIARFQKNEEVLLFLRKDAEGNLQVVGGSQGKFVISKDIRTAKKMVAAYTTLDEMKTQVTTHIRSGSAR